MNDNQRESHFRASIKNSFCHLKKRIEYDKVPYTIDEFKNILIEKSPVSLWCMEWSSKAPYFHITKQIMPSHGGVYGHFSPLIYSDIEVKFYSWKDLYNLFKNHLTDITF